MAERIIAVMLGWLAALPVAAQTGSALLLEPWQAWEQDEAQVTPWAELEGMALFQADADLDDTDEDLGLTIYESRGRFRPDPLQAKNLSFGYDLLHLDLDTHDDALPERLTDVSVAAGWSATGEQGRRLGLVAGVGYAGDAPFADSEAFYIQADVIYELPLDERSKLSLLFNYHGNRTFWPDVPLPAVSYAHRVNDTLSYVVGAPASEVRWRPHPRWLVNIRYYVPTTVDAVVEYELSRSWRLFAQFDNRLDAFVVDGQEDRRLFFSQRRLEAGVRYQPHPQCDLVLAGGYAFDQSFERGWDIRDLDTVRDVDDSPYLRGGLELRF